MTERPRILVVDDDREMASAVADSLAKNGFAVDACDSGTAALQHLGERTYAVLVTDLRIPDIDGLALLERARDREPDMPVIMMTAYGALETAIEAIRRGAYHYLIKPFQTDELVLFLKRALAEVDARREARDMRRTLLARTDGYSDLLGDSAPMHALRSVIARVAESPAPALIIGETGSGKGRIARIIHDSGPRHSAPFVTLNCAAVPAQLMESELFGHIRGAFTGANQARVGLIAEADGGTLFLDEIGDLDIALQAKLLDVLERGVVRPIGAERERAVNVRVLAATHVHLRDAVRTKRFREDLLYRLDVVTLLTPPLRERRDDIPMLAASFLAAARQRHPNSPVERLDASVMQAFNRYHWPGNVRELMHVVERAVILGMTPVLGQDELRRMWEPAPESIVPPSFAGDVQPLRAIARYYASWALAKLGGSKSRTADALDVDVKTLNTLLKEGC